MSNLLRITNKIEALGIWDSIPSDSINSVVIEFEFAEDWKNLLCVAQFTQGEKTYNVVIENNRCVLPTELKIGNVMLSVFGTKTDGTPFRETSIPFCFEIYDAGFSSTAETPIPPTPDLYEQLIDKFAHSNGVAALNGKTGNVDIVADEGISVDDTETGKIKIKSTAKITVDTEMSETSENPVQNKVVKKYVDEGHTVKLISSLILDVAEQGLYYTDMIEYQGKGVVFSDFCFILYSKEFDDRKTVIVVSSTGIEKLNLLNMKMEPIYNYTIIDDVLSDISNNAIANKVVTQALLQQEIDLKNYADSLKVTVDPEMSETSENPVQNKVVKGYVDQKTQEVYDEAEKKLDTIDGGTVSGNVEFTGDVIVQNAPTVPKSAVNKEYADSLKTVIDPEMSDTSENPVQNKVVKGYVDDKTKRGHLIYQTTLTEDVRQISISKDSNGQEFLLNNIAVIVCIPASPTLNRFAYLSLKINDFIPYNNQTVIGGGEEGKKHVVIFRCDRDNGLWSRMAGTGLNQAYTDYYMPSLKGVEFWDYYVNKFEAARNITLSPTGADRVIPKGTKIEVYGR